MEANSELLFEKYSPDRLGMALIEILGEGKEKAGDLIEQYNLHKLYNLVGEK